MKFSFLLYILWFIVRKIPIQYLWTSSKMDRNPTVDLGLPNTWTKRQTNIVQSSSSAWPQSLRLRLMSPVQRKCATRQSKDENNSTCDLWFIVGRFSNEGDCWFWLPGYDVWPRNFWLILTILKKLCPVVNVPKISFFHRKGRFFLQR